MKSYTNLEQSKKLAEFLPFESADMWYEDCGLMIPRLGHMPKEHTYTEVPCWSLAALLDILKYPSLTQDVENKWSITDWTGFYPKSEHGFDNPVDACVAMISELHKQKIL